MVQRGTMYSPDEVIAKLGEVGYDMASAGSSETTQMFRCSAYWEMGQLKARRTGYIFWEDTFSVDGGELDQLLERTVLEFTEEV